MVILDCCHSGSGTRDGEPNVAYRWMTADPPAVLWIRFSLPGQLSPSFALFPQPGRPTPAAGSPFPRGVTSCSPPAALRSWPMSTDAEGKKWGAFSYFLRTTLEKASGGLTYQDAFKEAQARVRASVWRQSPQLEATNLDDLSQPFLGGAIASRVPSYTVSFGGEGWALDAGAIHGVMPPQHGETTWLALFPLDASPDHLLRRSESLAQARVVDVRPGSSQLAIVSPMQLNPAHTYKATIISVPLPPVQVAFAGDPEGIDMIRAALEGSGPGGSLHNSFGR